MREVQYTVTLSPEGSSGLIDRPYFNITNVTAAVVVYQDPITGACGSKAQVSQKYSIRFVTSADQGQSKSGNPGYINGLPLLIGMTDTASGAINAFE